MSNETLLAQLFSHIDSKKREVKDWAKTWATNPKEAWERQKEAGRNFQPASTEQIMENALGHGMIKTVTPALAAHIQSLVKGGMSLTDALKSFQAFPKIGTTGRIEGYAQAIPTTAGRTPEKTVMDVLSGRPSIPLKEFYEGAEREALEQAAPKSVNIPVYARLVEPNEKAGGSFFRGENPYITAEARSFQGPYGVRGVVAHEGTHAFQKEYDLAHGANANVMRPQIAANLLENPEAQVLFKELSKRRSHPDWTAYRSVAGEEAANLAKKSAIGQPVQYDNPLAMQMVEGKEFLSPEYIRRYRILQELQRKGQFDPFKAPMDLPPGWEGLYPPK